MFKSITLFSLVVILLVGSDITWARSKRVAQIPNGDVNKCANCHTNPAGGGARNDFGKAVAANLDSNGDVIWRYALARLDSDGDGIPNGVELQDANALWTSGSTAPGILDRVRNPGDTDSSHDDVLTVQFEGMNPHDGQLFELKLFEQGDDSEKEMVRIDELFAADFSIAIFGIDTGKSYQVDFYADHNGNKSYDAPPTDHAWREVFTNTTGNYILGFTHNTNFTDISSPTAITDYLSLDLPTSYELNQNYPNPFNPSTKLKFSIPATDNVFLTIYNNLGQRVRTLVDSRMSAGVYEVDWDGKNDNGLAMSTGVYFYQITASDFKQTKRMMLIR